ncbi:MAG: glyoxalase/bleomycin resistance protein/dioxygenase [Acidimicrobiales bacterium]|nr:glyoxalase/bleomycin resistance protein/dioxygenase [Acidimicrobiales bacterium]
MLRDAELIAFVAVADLDRARTFYTGVLGLTVVDANPVTLVLDANGTMLRLTAVPDLKPRPFTVAGWRVTDIDAAVDDLAAAGVTTLRFDAMDQDERGIWTTPGGDRVAWFHDPDRNTLSVTSFAADA